MIIYPIKLPVLFLPKLKVTSDAVRANDEAYMIFLEFFYKRQKHGSDITLIKWYCVLFRFI